MRELKTENARCEYKIIQASIPATKLKGKEMKVRNKILSSNMSKARKQAREAKGFTLLEEKQSCPAKWLT